MKKLIERVFKVKILPAKTYDELTDRISECGLIYRKYSHGEYHSGGRSVSVPLSKLDHMCTVENLLWNDVKHKIHRIKQ